MSIGEVLDLDAVGQATALRRRLVTSEELVSAAQDRIAELNPDLGAIIHMERPQPPPAGRSGPFDGVPLLVKDLWCDIAGEPSWSGLRVLAERGHRASRDDVAALRLQGAGFVVVGRTNTSELGLSVATEPQGFPPTRNPNDRERSPGGSSGGSAAAVSAGMVAIAHGSDMAGSLRLPAAWCGVVGFKPSRGRPPPPSGLSRAGHALMQEHVLTRSIRDTRATLAAVTAAGGPRTTLSDLRTGPDRTRSAPALRIGVALSLGDGGAVEPGVRDAVHRVADVFDQAGHQVVFTRPPPLEDPHIRDFQVAMAAAHADAELRRISGILGLPVGERDVGLPVWWLAQFARGQSERQLQHLHFEARRWARRCRSWWRPHPLASDSGPSGEPGYDLLVTPTVAHTAPPIGTVDEVEATRFTFPFNLTGQPAISVPVPGPGLPVGVQLVAAPWQDETLLAAAEMLETVMGPRPPVPPT